MEENGYDKLGFYILAVLYFFMGVGSLMSTAIINKFGTRFCLIIGGFGIVSWILSSLLAVFDKDLLDQGVPMGVIYAGLFAGTILNGFTVGILWASAN